MSSSANWLRRQNAPVTLGLIAVLVLFTFILPTLPSGVQGSLAFDAQWYGHPWSLLTYSFIFPGGPGNLVGLFFLAWWGLMIGGMVEREMSSRRYGIFLAAVAIGSPLVMWVGAMLFQSPVTIFGPFFIDAAVAVAWGTRFASLELRILGVLPIQARVIGWLFTIGLYLVYGIGNPVLGTFALLPLLAVWAFAENKLPFAFGPRLIERTKAAGRGVVQYDEAYYDEVRKREQERAEKERLRKLLGE